MGVCVCTTILGGVSLTVRSAAEADLPALAELAARTFPLACPPELAREAVDDFISENLTEKAFRGYLTDPGHIVLVACDSDGRVRAYALLVEGTTMDEACVEMIVARPTLGISKFYLDPGLHGGGGAVGLLEAIISRSREHGVQSLWLATNIDNARARRFYVKNGFLERGQRVFVVGGTSNRDVVLELPL